MNYYNTGYDLPAYPPDDREKKMLRRYYFRISWIILALIFVFSVVNRIVMAVAAAIMGGGFSAEEIAAGKELVRSVPVMKTIYSYGFPIAADIAALGIGVIVTRADLKAKLRFRGFTGGDVCKFTALSFGIVTVGALANMIILLIIETIAALMEGTSASDVSSSIPVTTAAPEAGNPLWLDVLIYCYICLLGPILEELIFRGVLLEGLRKYGNAFGIILSSILFGLMHQNFAQCLPAFCMGLVWATIAIKSGSLLPSMFMHILNNTLSAILMVMLESLDTSNITGLAEQLMASIPILTAFMLNLLLRLVCIIASIVIIARHSMSRKKLVATTEYSRRRTWSYIFTSLPWLVAIGYMLLSTVLSISV